MIHASFDSVSSGGKGMAFYWRGNKLFTKHGERESTDDDDGLTTFLFEMREPIEVIFIILLYYYMYFAILTSH